MESGGVFIRASNFRRRGEVCRSWCVRAELPGQLTRHGEHEQRETPGDRGSHRDLEAMTGNGCVGVWSRTKASTRRLNVLEFQRAKFFEWQTKPVADLLAYHARDADRADWADALQPCCDIHAVAMHIRPVGNDVANIDTHGQAHPLVWRVIAVEDWHRALHLDCEAHR